MKLFLIIFFLVISAILGNSQTQKPIKSAPAKPSTVIDAGPMATNVEVRLKAEKVIEPLRKQIAALKIELGELDSQRKNVLKTRALKLGFKGSTSSEDDRLKEIATQANHRNTEIGELLMRIQNIEIGMGIKKVR